MIKQEVLSVVDPKWDELLAMMPYEKQDIYFTSWYYKLEQIEGHGVPKMYTYQDGEKVVLYPFLVNEIPSKYELSEFYDIETAYGYGGPISNSEDINFLSDFENTFISYCMENKIIAEFIRFHTLIDNYKLFHKNISVLQDRTTVWLDLTRGIDDLWMDGVSPRYRTKIRKAEKLGLFCVESRDYKDFMRLYEMTMSRDNADGFYFWSEDYFKTLMQRDENVILYVKNADNKIIAGNLLMVYGEYIHYHLGCSDTEFLNYNPNNLMIWKAAEYGIQKGCKKYHLGGGLSGAPCDQLFQFKRGFSKERAEFYIGKRVHNREIYDKLISEWEKEKECKAVKLLSYRD